MTITYISAVPHRIDTLAALFGEMATDPRVASMQGDEIAALYPASEHRVWGGPGSHHARLILSSPPGSG